MTSAQTALDFDSVSPKEELPLLPWCALCGKTRVELKGFRWCRPCIEAKKQGGSVRQKASFSEEDSEETLATTEKDLLTSDQVDVVTIDDLALDEEFVRFTRDLAYWNARYTKANEVFLEARHNYELIRAQLWLEIRTEEQAAEHKVTVDDLKAMVLVREEHEQAHLKLVRAEAERERLKKFAESVAAKRDMLKEIGSKLRVEMLGDPTIREQHREAKRYGE